MSPTMNTRSYPNANSYRVFKNREEAGRLLAPKVKRFLKNDLPSALLLALPRGGVPIAFEIARALEIPMDVLLVRKIGAPFHPEYGIGAITEENYSWIDENSVNRVGATPLQIHEIMEHESAEIKTRLKKYRDDQPLPSLHGRTVILVDDGIATGVTARVAARYVKNRGAERVFLASPVCSQETAGELRSEIDQVICLDEPEVFLSVGQFYSDFEQVSDEEVVDFIARAKRLRVPHSQTPFKTSSHSRPDSNTSRGGNLTKTA